MKFIGRLSAALVALLGAVLSAPAVTFTTIDPPESGPPWGNNVTGIGGGNISGWYRSPVSDIYHGYRYDGTTWTLIDYPAAYATFVDNVWGTQLVGRYEDTTNFDTLPFYYDGTTFQTLAYPGATTTYVSDVNAGKVVGSYTDASGVSHGYLYDGTSYTPLNDPLAGSDTDQGTSLKSISGNKILGTYTDSSGNFHYFTFDGTSYTTFAMTHPTLGDVTPIDIDGAEILGLTDLADVVWDGGNWITIDYPSYMTTRFSMGIEGNRVVGGYHIGFPDPHGFVAILPEPSGLLLIAAALSLALRRRNSPIG